MKPIQAQISEIYQKYRLGEPISNQEVQLGIDKLTEYTEFLINLRERFHFVWFALYDCIQHLEQFRENRKRDGNW